MPNYLQMPKQRQVVALRTPDSSCPRIEAEADVWRETGRRCDRALRTDAAKVLSSSVASASTVPPRPRRAEAALRSAITE